MKATRSERASRSMSVMPQDAARDFSDLEPDRGTVLDLLFAWWRGPARVQTSRRAAH